ncbi:MAG: hypothetical protein QXK24_05675 [Ignisphaera sp.]|uniref:Uncharacterized protein n=1 Tax=Ignisphaera aggregans TaxID=334771 RepID=A0A7J3JS28_9CREN
MPPTELMKILSRADHIKKEFIKFLHDNNVVSNHGKEYGYLNPLPYTLDSFLLDLENKNVFLKCFGTSFCFENILEGVHKEYANRLNINGINLYFNNGFYIYSIPSDRLKMMRLLGDEEILALFPKDITSIQMYSDYDENVVLHSISGDRLHSELEGVRALAIFSGYHTLSVVSSNLMTVRCPNRKVCLFYISGRNTILLSPSEPIINLVRRYHLNHFIIASNFTLNIETPLVEFLDFTTLSLPITFDSNCIRFAIFNPLHRVVNSIIKSYRYLTRIIIDDLTEYNYRHSIVRIGLPPNSSTKFEVCLHML